MSLLRILTQQPAATVRLARRLCDWLMGEKAVSETAIAALAEGLRGHDLDIGWAVATVLRSRAFWDGANLRSRVLGPVEMVIGSLRALELLDPPLSTLIVGEWIAKLGQDLFYPPNVGGWPGGRAWLSSRGLIGRANFAAALVSGRGVGLPMACDALGLARANGIPSGREPVIRFFAELVFGGEPEHGWLDRIASSLGARQPGDRRQPGAVASSWPAPPGKLVDAFVSSTPALRRVSMQSRRVFLNRSLRGSSLIALAPTVPGFLVPAARAAGPDRDGRVLVVIQLDGGNDGINMVVPFADPGYARHRRVLRLPANDLIKLNGELGLHPGMREAERLLQSDRLAIIPGVGYPNPDRSHFRSMAIWHTARLVPEGHDESGWLGRGIDAMSHGRSSAVFVGSGTPPLAIRGRRSIASSLERIDDLFPDPRIEAARAFAVGGIG